MNQVRKQMRQQISTQSIHSSPPIEERKTKHNTKDERMQWLRQHQVHWDLWKCEQDNKNANVLPCRLCSFQGFQQNDRKNISTSDVSLGSEVGSQPHLWGIFCSFHATGFTPVALQCGFCFLLPECGLKRKFTGTLKMPLNHVQRYFSLWSWSGAQLSQLLCTFCLKVPHNIYSFRMATNALVP